MSDQSDALQSALKKIAADLAARGPMPYVWLPQLNERDRPRLPAAQQLPEPNAMQPVSFVATLERICL